MNKYFVCLLFVLLGIAGTFADVGLPKENAEETSLESEQVTARHLKEYPDFTDEDDEEADDEEEDADDEVEDADENEEEEEDEKDSDEDELPKNNENEINPRKKRQSFSSSFAKGYLTPEERKQNQQAWKKYYNRN